jgi:hypothetical protein
LSSLLQGSPNFQALSLFNITEDEIVHPCLTRAFKTCTFLRTLDLHFCHFDQGDLPILLTPILEGQTPTLKELSLSASLGDDSIDILVQCFTILSVIGLQFNSFSRRGKARIQQAAENYPTLTLWLSDEEEDSDTEEEGEDEEEIGEGNDEGSDDEAASSNDTEEEDG